MAKSAITLVPTVTVYAKDGDERNTFTINESDFNPEIHAKVGAKIARRPTTDDTKKSDETAKKSVDDDKKSDDKKPAPQTRKTKDD